MMLQRTIKYVIKNETKHTVNLVSMLVIMYTETSSYDVTKRMNHSRPLTEIIGVIKTYYFAFCWYVT